LQLGLHEKNDHIKKKKRKKKRTPTLHHHPKTTQKKKKKKKKNPTPPPPPQHHPKKKKKKKKNTKKKKGQKTRVGTHMIRYDLYLSFFSLWTARASAPHKTHYWVRVTWKPPIARHPWPKPTAYSIIYLQKPELLL
jgi:outer membrane biosynthesis protein TonB